VVASLSEKAGQLQRAITAASAKSAEMFSDFRTISFALKVVLQNLIIGIIQNVNRP
jgi:hypothetical protein